MSATNQTTTLNLPQWVGSDKPTFLGDLNNAFSNIDNYLCVETENDLKFGKSLSDSYKGIRIIKNDKFMTSDKKTNASEILKFILKDN